MVNDITGILVTEPVESLFFRMLAGASSLKTRNPEQETVTLSVVIILLLNVFLYTAAGDLLGYTPICSAICTGIFIDCVHSAEVSIILFPLLVKCS